MVWLMLHFTSDPDVSQQDAYWCRTLGEALRELLGNTTYAIAEPLNVERKKKTA